MNKKKLILTIGLSALAVCAIVICFILIAKPFTPKGDGEITVEYVALDGTIIKEKEIVFNEGEQLIDLIKENFDNVVFENGMILGIEDFVTDSTWNPFISIYVDGEASMVGIVDIEYTDGTVISLRLTSFEPM